MNWSMQQVRWVSALRTTLRVDLEQIESVPPGVGASAAGSLLSQELAKMAQPYGVDIDRQDVKVRQRPDEVTPHSVLFTARWWPAVTEVELSVPGGTDGQVLQLREVGEPLVVSVHPTIGALRDKAPEELVPQRKVVFELDGWNETHRRWIYRTR